MYFHFVVVIVMVGSAGICSNASSSVVFLQVTLDLKFCCQEVQVNLST